jgi:GNAT superfamily N-acetyltransferase
MTIRDATPRDLAEIMAMIHELAEYEESAHEVAFDATELERHLFGAEPVAHVLVAEVGDGHVAGMALWFRSYSTWLGRPGIWLEDLFVRPAHRREGIGRQLVQALRARTEGRVEWAVLDWNQPAIDFYRSLGAEPVDGWTRYRWEPGG